MIKSMTGYGRCEVADKAKKITGEIRSVNHRYFDINIRVPRNYSFLEEYIREYVSTIASRGKIDVYVGMENYADEQKEVIVDEGLAGAYIQAVEVLTRKFDIRSDISASFISRLPDVLIVEKQPEDKDKIWEQVKGVLAEAAGEFVAMRCREGERISHSLIERCDYIHSVVDEIEKRMPQIVQEYTERLKKRIAEILEDKNIDEARLLTEAAIFADKTCTDEEVVRLRSHLVELKTSLGQDAPSGRRLDFLIQEINREINTIGSKSNDLSTTRMVVDLKAEMEKLREQVQNIE